MRKLDQPTARALASLRNTPEFKTYVAWLEQSLAETNDTLRSAEGVQVGRTQGRAQCLVDQLKKIDESREIAQRFEQAHG